MRIVLLLRLARPATLRDAHRCSAKKIRPASELAGMASLGQSSTSPRARIPQRRLLVLLFWGISCRPTAKSQLTATALLSSFLPSAQSIEQTSHLTLPTSAMLASSRTALRQAATKQLSLKASVRAVSVWSQVPQGPPVSNNIKCTSSQENAMLICVCRMYVYNWVDGSEPQLTAHS